MKQKTLLIIEDNRSLSIAISALAERCKLRPTTAPTLARARQAINEQHASTNQPFDFILLDIGLPDGHGLDLLKQKIIPPQTHTAIISAHGDLENAIAARKLGATHFFNKPIDFDSLEAFLTEYSQEPPTAETSGQYPSNRGNAPLSPPLIGASDNMLKVFQRIAQACTNSDPVVIRGEAGTGKSHVAQLIQAHTTPRKSALFIATPQTKPEEITTHLIQNPRSTLLIKNLARLPVASQQQLLITLDNLQGQAPRLLVTVDDDGLYQHSLSNRILPDLYYRLQVLEIHLPPLRNRPGDIPALTSYFLGELDTSRTRELSAELIATLQKYPWPGNLRELRNLVSYLVHTHTESRILQPHHLPPHFFDQQQRQPTDPLTTHLMSWVSQKLDSPEHPPSYKELHGELEGRLLHILMERFDHKQSRLANSLNMNRSTLRKKLGEL
ncbi:MAG: sigma-54-dependent Fis family transcriptional regulator [Akkermansiaceae bacterium]|nr:sigma-54-dependent Fis family transcriptional regulator [Akkermansiaceae bacterium]